MTHASPNAVSQVSFRKLKLVAEVAALVGIAAGAICYLAAPERFFRAYLVGYNVWIGVSLGCAMLLMIQSLSGGAWGLLLRSVLEAGASTVPLMGLLFLPLVPGVKVIYSWAAETETMRESSINREYLNVDFFLIRAAVYFAIWIVVYFGLRFFSRRAQVDPSARATRRLGLFAAGGLLLYGLSITFSAIDWVMSLQIGWASTIFPPIFGVGQILSAMAFAIMAIAVRNRAAPLPAELREDRWRDLGNLLLTFVLCWAYLSFSQYLLIWSGNLPEEIPWYLQRIRGGWQFVALALAAFQFAAPLIFLLSRRNKDNLNRLAKIAEVVFVMRFLDVLWWIEAAYPDGLSRYVFVDFAVCVGFGGLWLLWFVRALERSPLLPYDDPYFAEYLPELTHG
jgi:hypothetical protein